MQVVKTAIPCWCSDRAWFFRKLFSSSVSISTSLDPSMWQKYWNRFYLSEFSIMPFQSFDRFQVWIVCRKTLHSIRILHVPLILSSHCQHALQKGSRNCRSLTSRGDSLTEQVPLYLKKKPIKLKSHLKSRCWNVWQLKIYCH